MVVAPALRSTALLSAVSAAGAGAIRLAREPIATVWTPLRHHGPAALGDALVSFDSALAALCAVLLVGCALWLVATTTVAVLAHVVADLAPSSRSADVLDRASVRGCPRTLRRLVALALGVALTGGAGVGAASAASAPAPPEPTANGLPANGLPAPGGLTLLDGLALPDRTTGTGIGSPGPTRRTEPQHAPRSTAVDAVPGTSAGNDGAPHQRRRAVPHPPAVEPDPPPATGIQVLPGDSLWRIAERLLPARAGDGPITGAWHRLHAANRAAIGPDPDLVLPGIRLHLPSLSDVTPQPRSGAAHPTRPPHQAPHPGPA